MLTAHNLSSRSIQYYAIARKWASDLEFFRIETAFLHRLLEDHYIRLSIPVYFEQLSNIAIQLQELDNNNRRAETLVEQQLKYLEQMAEDVIPESADELTGTQIKLEQLVANITAGFRVVKKELFEAVTAILNERKILNN